MQEMFFYIFACCVCVFSILAVTRDNIFHCALWLAMTLLSISGIYFYLEAPFLGVVQILVYVGGIVTLFVFTIKLTARIEDKTVRQTSKQWAPAGLITIILLSIFVRIFSLTHWAGYTPGLKRVVYSIPLTKIGESLMRQYALPFEFISVILLSAMVGAIVIGKVKK
jgi:NADH-quinone oxidoreductase subunit J